MQILLAPKKKLNTKRYIYKYLQIFIMLCILNYWKYWISMLNYENETGEYWNER
jgi:hypothetical protein